MISATQRELLALLTELCELSNDVRFGQLLAHLGFLGEDQTARTLWDIDDEQLLAVLYQHRSELVARAEANAGRSIPLAGSPTATQSPNASSPANP